MSSSSAPGANSSSSRSKRELIDRIRYPNPIPLPPYPPKLVKINADPARYANPHFSDRIASSHPLPVIVDAHAGMPINLAIFQDIWENNLREVTVPLNEHISHDDIDDADAFLLQDFSAALPNAAGAPGSVGFISSLNAIADSTAQASIAAATQQRNAQTIGPNAKTALQADHVTWLRRTEYLSAEQKKAQQQAQKPKQVERIDTSREAQLTKIEVSFKEAQKPIADLVHPTKRGVKAVQSFELLPDPETWATDYQIVRFIDPPGRLSNGVPIKDPRLDVAILRPVQVGDEQRVSYYLPTGEDLPEDPEEASTFTEDQTLEDEKARRLRKRKRTGKYPLQKEGDESVSRNDAETAFKWIRDYVPKDTTESSHDVLLFSLDDGVPDPDPDAEVDPISGVKRKADEEEDEDLFGGDDDEEGSNGTVDSTEIPQSEQERQKRCKRCKLTKGKERSENPEGTGATIAITKKPKAYYHKVGMRFTLRVWRSRVANNEKLRNKDRRYPDKWDAIRMTNREMTERELLRRMHIRSKVDDLGTLDPYEESEEEVEEEEMDAEAEGEAEKRADEEAETRSRHDEQEADEEDAGAEREGSDKASVAEEKPEASDNGDGAQDKASEDGGDDDNDDDDDEEDDDEDEDAESIDADEELAALKEEAQGAGDEGGDEGEEGGRRSRSRRAPTAAQDEAAPETAAAEDGEDKADMDVDTEEA